MFKSGVKVKFGVNFIVVDIGFIVVFCLINGVDV